MTVLRECVKEQLLHHFEMHGFKMNDILPILSARKTLKHTDALRLLYDFSRNTRCSLLRALKLVSTKTLHHLNNFLLEQTK